MMIYDNDVWVLLLSTVRYSMGRQTYMSSLAPEMALRYAAALTSKQVEQMRDEVLNELNTCEKAGQTLGGDMDHRSWKKFAEDLSGLLVPAEVHES